MNHLVSAKDTPTHKLIVKLEDGTFKTFYLTEKEATWMASVINGVDRFIVLPKTIDPAAPSFYPKQGATMSRMSREELDARATRYINMAKPVRDEEVEKAKAESTAKVRAWVKEHPQEFEQMEREAEERLAAQKGMFHIASKNVKRNLIRYEALRALWAKMGLV